MSQRISEPSGRGDTSENYSFDVARMYLPEERKAFCVRMIRTIDNTLARVDEFIAADASESEATSLEPLLKGVKLLMEFPVPSDLLERVNMEAKDDGREVLDWENVRRLYGISCYAKLRSAFEPKNMLGEGVLEEVVSTFMEIKKDLKNFLKTCGGDSDIRLGDILEEYKIGKDSSWHQRSLGDVEKNLYANILKLVKKRFGAEYAEIFVDELGSGSGRCIQQLAEVLGLLSLSKEDKIAFIRKYSAIDICEKNVNETRIAVANTLLNLESEVEDVDKIERVELGNFHDEEGHGQTRLVPGSIHFILSTMRTQFHNLTEGELVKCLKYISEGLKPGTRDSAGGLFLLDAVPIPQYEVPSEAEASELNDLKNLYLQLRFAYARRYQKIMPDGVNLGKMPRFPIYDNTTGRGFYWREVPTPEYMEHIIKKHGLNLELLRDEERSSNKKNEFTREEATQLGRKWILDNNLEEHYKGQINERLRSGALDQSLASRFAGPNQVEDLLDQVAHEMVSGFTSRYLIFQRPKRGASRSDIPIVA